MKTLLSIIALCLFANIALAKEASIKGEWKGSYVINAHVTTINFYINSNDSEQKVIVDVPSNNLFGLEYNLVYKNGQVYLTRKNKNDVLIEFKGTLKNNIVTGTYHYNNEYMKDKPGIFQLMKSRAPFINGDVFPNFNLSLIDGNTISNNSYKGKYILLDFWATWCPPCIAKRPKLEKLSKEYSDKLKIVSISLDADIDIVSSFRKAKYPMDWNHAIKPEKMKDDFVKKFVPGGLPYGYILNPEGKIVAFGNDLSAENLIDTFNRVISKN